MRTIHGTRYLLHSLAAVMLSAAAAGCSMMHDDLEDCATRPRTYTSVKFVYDYNTRAADLFNDHVGAVTLYVFDNDGRLRQQQEITNKATAGALKSSSFKVDLNLDPGKYNVYAVAQAHHAGYDQSLQELGAKFRRADFQAESHVDDYYITLDHNAGQVQHQGVLIDTLWTTLRPQTLVIPETFEPAEGDPQQPDVNVSATIPLMRVTNRLHISFYQEDFPTRINPADYDIWITTNSGSDKMNILGDFTADAAPLTFTPFKTWAGTDDRSNACVNAEFGLTRFMNHAAQSSRANLNIRNKITGHVTVIDHIEKLLAQGREAYAPNNWSEQEYLDREYDYDLAICLTDKTWKFAQVRVNILSWSKRIQNADL